MPSLWERWDRLVKAHPRGAKVFCLCCQLLCVVLNFTAGLINGFLLSYLTAALCLYFAVRSLRELRETENP